MVESQPDVEAQTISFGVPETGVTPQGVRIPSPASEPSELPHPRLGQEIEIAVGTENVPYAWNGRLTLRDEKGELVIVELSDLRGWLPPHIQQDATLSLQSCILGDEPFTLPAIDFSLPGTGDKVVLTVFAGEPSLHRVTHDGGLLEGPILTIRQLPGLGGFHIFPQFQELRVFGDRFALPYRPGMRDEYQVSTSDALGSVRVNPPLPAEQTRTIDLASSRVLHLKVVSPLPIRTDKLLLIPSGAWAEAQGLPESKWPQTAEVVGLESARWERKQVGGREFHVLNHRVQTRFQGAYEVRWASRPNEVPGYVAPTSIESFSDGEEIELRITPSAASLRCSSLALAFSEPFDLLVRECGLPLNLVLRTNSEDATVASQPLRKQVKLAGLAPGTELTQRVVVQFEDDLVCGDYVLLSLIHI